ncbi:globin domain-containing protein [Sphingomonas sp. RB3P16]|uniref:globin domain-containing protein n=1 Tax=Parasphingomonas frigoris TaxID=3096163 RepID=UPI002FC6FE9B
MTRLSDHSANCDSQIIGIAIDQRSDTCLDHILADAGRTQAGDQRCQVGLMTMHAFQELRRYFEGLCRTWGRLKLIDTHRTTHSSLQPDPTGKRLMEFERPKRLRLTAKGYHIRHLPRHMAKVKATLVRERLVSLTTEQVRLVRQSYALILQSPNRYAEIFYHRLLLMHPFARALFPDDMTHQIEVFTKTIDMLIQNVANLDRLHPILSDLAKRHVKYGVRAYQYEAVGTVLIDTFEEMIGVRFTSEIRQAWGVVYADTAGIMIAEAYPESE